MKYLEKKFSVAVGSKAYADNFDAIFGPKASTEPPAELVEGAPAVPATLPRRRDRSEMIRAYVCRWVDLIGCTAPEALPYRIGQIAAEVEGLVTDLGRGPT
jgi:hypothetical protein